MTFEKSLDPRYRVNIKLDMRVMIEEENNSSLLPCYVKEIITSDAKHESGIKVICENGKIGRVKHIGTETNFMSPMELVTNLEKKLRQLIAEELSSNDSDWWKNKIAPMIQENAELKHSKNITKKKLLQIPNYELIEETDFPELLSIMIAKKNWKNHFEKIFYDDKALFVKLDEIAPYRNLSAHSKDVTPHIEKKIHVYYDDIVDLIEKYQRTKS
jgi:uncharacterized repeat protein (TIGR03833 family)